MPRMKGIWGETWALCDRCGFLHPNSMLVRQKALLLCTDHGCLDNLEIEKKDQTIARKLGEPGEFEAKPTHPEMGEFPTF